MPKKRSNEHKQKASPPKATPEELARAAKRAESLARKAHAGQVDRAGTPYIKHVRRVADACAHLGPAAVAAAWLHDTVEDERLMAEDIKDRFPAEVASIIWHLTRGENETYSEYISRMITNKNGTAILVKLADLRDHAAVTPETLTPGLKRRYDMAYQKLVQSRSLPRRQLPEEHRASPFAALVDDDERKRSTEIIDRTGQPASHAARAPTKASKTEPGSAATSAAPDATRATPERTTRKANDETRPTVGGNRNAAGRPPKEGTRGPGGRPAAPSERSHRPVE